MINSQRRPFAIDDVVERQKDGASLLRLPVLC